MLGHHMTSPPPPPVSRAGNAFRKMEQGGDWSSEAWQKILLKAFNSAKPGAMEDVLVWDEEAPPLPAPFVAFCEAQVRCVAAGGEGGRVLGVGGGVGLRAAAL